MLSSVELSDFEETVLGVQRFPSEGKNTPPLGRVDRHCRAAG